VREKCTLPFHGLFYVLHFRFHLFHFLHTFHTFHFLHIFLSSVFAWSRQNYTLNFSIRPIEFRYLTIFFENRRVNVNLTLHTFHAPFLRDHAWDSQKNKNSVHLHMQSVISKKWSALFTGFFYVLHFRFHVFHFLHTFHTFHLLHIFFVFGFCVITSELHFTLFTSANRVSLFDDFFWKSKSERESRVTHFSPAFFTWSRMRFPKK